MEFARQNKHPYVDNLERIQCLLQVRVSLTKSSALLISA